MQINEVRLMEIIHDEISLYNERKIQEAIYGLIIEGVYDPGILKAVFMAGGPGSGKSYTAKDTFGGIQKVIDREAMEELFGEIIGPVQMMVKDAVNSMSTDYGLRLVNSDPAFEKFLKDIGVDPKDLKDMSPQEFHDVTELPGSPRDKAKKARNRQKAAYMKGRIGMVMDGTGDDYGKIAGRKAELESIGYDTAMIFVNTTLEVALDRNRNRDRVLKDSLVEEIWTKVQANVDQFKNLFGGNFIVINNTSYKTDEAKTQAMDAARAFVESPIQNPIGRKWVEEELAWKEFEYGPDDEKKKAPDQREKLLGSEPRSGRDR